MPANYTYDVFLSHSTRDKAVVRQVAENLRQNGLRVWFDEWVILPGQLISRAIEEGLEQSRVLVLAMSKSAFESDWVTLESQAALFRDPINRDRGFIPFRIDSFDDAQMPRMLRGFKYIDIKEANAISRLAESCGAKTVTVPASVAPPGSVPLIATPEPETGPTATADRAWRVTQQMLRDRLNEQYEIGECIHFDSDEMLFVARDRIMGRNVAIKVPNLPKYEADVVARRFYRKIQSVSMVNHSNIVPVHAGFQIDQLPILVMGYVGGVNLDELIERTGAQPLRKILKLLEDVGDALKYSHRLRANHHRLRPQNILYDEDGNAMVTPMNFAPSNTPTVISRNSKEYDLRISRYEAPERFFRVPDELDKADQYSLGMMAYEMLVGKNMTDAETYETLRQSKNAFLNPEVPRAAGRTNCPTSLWKVIQKMLARKKEDRYESFSDLVEAVRKVSGKELGLERDRKTVLGNAIRIVHNSLRRCRLQPGFFHDLYQQLLKNEAVQAIFTKRGVDVLKADKQQWLLREGLDLLISYADEPKSPKLHVLSRVAQSHGRYRIRVEMYDSFLEALQETVRRHDIEFEHLEDDKSNEIENAWARVLRPGLDYLKSQVPKGMTATAHR